MRLRSVSVEGCGQHDSGVQVLCGTLILWEPTAAAQDASDAPSKHSRTSQCRANSVEKPKHTKNLLKRAA